MLKLFSSVRCEHGQTSPQREAALHDDGSFRDGEVRHVRPEPSAGAETRSSSPAVSPPVSPGQELRAVAGRLQQRHVTWQPRVALQGQQQAGLAQQSQQGRSSHPQGQGDAQQGLQQHRLPQRRGQVQLPPGEEQSRVRGGVPGQQTQEALRPILRLQSAGRERQEGGQCGPSPGGIPVRWWRLGGETLKFHLPPVSLQGRPGRHGQGGDEVRGQVLQRDDHQAGDQEAPVGSRDVHEEQQEHEDQRGRQDDGREGRRIFLCRLS